MGIFEGQIKNAKVAKELTGLIAPELRSSFSVRPTATSLTLYSVFDFAPMRGVSGNARKIREKILKINEGKNILLGNSCDVEEKIIYLKSLKFKKKPEAKHASTYLEEDVQAHYIRELMRNKLELKSLGYDNLSFLASEFQWSKVEEQETMQIKKILPTRIDIVCYDKSMPNKILIMELKKKRQQTFNQGEYKYFLKKNESEFRNFYNALIGNNVKEELDFRMIYVMPDYEDIEKKRKDKEEWKRLMNDSDCKIDGILFYTKDKEIEHKYQETRFIPID